MTIYQQISSNQLKTWFIMTMFVALFSGLFYLIGWYMGDSQFFLILGLLISFGSAFFSYFYSDRVVLMTVKAKPASREEYFDFYTVTENLAIAAGIPMPRLYVVQDKAPNAFATGRDPKHAVVCATSGLLSRLDRGELEGVIAHELAHIKNYDILLMSIVSVLVGTIALVTEWILRIMLRKGVKSRNKNPILLILLILALILSPIAAQLIRFAVSRRREFLADASGALLTRNPAGLASALEKIAKYTQGVDSATTSTAHLFISNPLPREKAANWLQNLFSTHPPIEERIKLLRAM